MSFTSAASLLRKRSLPQEERHATDESGKEREEPLDAEEAFSAPADAFDTMTQLREAQRIASCENFSFPLTLVGIKHHDQDAALALADGDPVALLREPFNAIDCNAIRVVSLAIPDDDVVDDDDAEAPNGGPATSYGFVAWEVLFSSALRLPPSHRCALMRVPPPRRKQENWRLPSTAARPASSPLALRARATHRTVFIYA